ARVLWRKAPIGSERREQKARLDAGQRARQITAMRLGGIKIIQRPSEQQIGIGIEIARELLALVAQVGFDFELDIKPVTVLATVLGITLRTAKLGGHAVTRQIRDVPDHARDRQATAR